MIGLDARVLGVFGGGASEMQRFIYYFIILKIFVIAATQGLISPCSNICLCMYWVLVTRCGERRKRCVGYTL